MARFEIGEHVGYRSLGGGVTFRIVALGGGVTFRIVARCEDGRWALECVESAYQYEGGWPIGRLMLADEIMIAELRGSRYDLLRRIHKRAERLERDVGRALDEGINYVEINAALGRLELLKRVSRAREA